VIDISLISKGGISCVLWTSTIFNQSVAPHRDFNLNYFCSDSNSKKSTYRQSLFPRDITGITRAIQKIWAVSTLGTKPLKGLFVAKELHSMICVYIFDYRLNNSLKLLRYIYAESSNIKVESFGKFFMIFYISSKTHRLNFLPLAYINGFLSDVVVNISTKVWSEIFSLDMRSFDYWVTFNSVSKGFDLIIDDNSANILVYKILFLGDASNYTLELKSIEQFAKPIHS